MMAPLRLMVLSFRCGAVAVIIHIGITAVGTDWADYATEWDPDTRFRWFRITWLIAVAFVAPFFTAMLIERLSREGVSWLWCLPLLAAVCGASYFDPPAPTNVTSQQSMIGAALWAIVIVYLVFLSFWPSLAIGRREKP